MTNAELDAKLAKNKNELESVQKTTEEMPSVAQATKAQWWSTQDAMTMSAALLIFGVIVLAMATAVIRSGKKTDAVIKVFGTVLIVIVSVFLVVAGYSETQIAPVMGLLGTIAGYILGKDSSNEQNPPRGSATPGGKPLQSRDGAVGAGGEAAGPAGNP